MARQREGSKRQVGWLPNSSVSLNAGTGWGAADPSPEAKQANADTGPLHEQKPQPRYLTTSGLFERPSKPSAWEPVPEPPEMVNEFRSALHRPQSKEDIQPRKGRKGIWAFGILLAAVAATIYLYHPGKSIAEFQTGKTWVAKQWASELRDIHTVFHSQAAAPSDGESNRVRGLSAFSRERRTVNPGMPAAPASLLETRPNEKVTPFDLYVSDSYGRRWILTATGLEFGPLNPLGDPSDPNLGARAAAPKACRSLFYRPECP